MAANSSASSAISRIGSAQISAKCAFATGATNGLGSRTTLDCGAPVHGSPITPDPLLRIEPPAYTGCKGLPDGNPSVLEPGTYCGKTLTGDITLQPGNYILRGGQISLGGGGSLAGDGATIFLMDGAAMTLDGNQTISLKAPAAGDFQGIAIYQERGNSNQLTLTGASGSAITGFIYAPSAHIRYRGNSATSGDGECIRIVGSTIDLLGNSSIELDCESELGGRDIKAGDQHPRIVE